MASFENTMEQTREATALSLAYAENQALRSRIAELKIQVEDMSPLIGENAYLKRRIAELEAQSAKDCELIESLVTGQSQLSNEIAELEAERGKVPEGYALVPVEPTALMMAVGGKARPYVDDDEQELIDLNTAGTWEAMLAAAPSPVKD
jgi:hypothetical protein